MVLFVGMCFAFVFNATGECRVLCFSQGHGGGQISREPCFVYHDLEHAWRAKRGVFSRECSLVCKGVSQSKLSDVFADLPYFFAQEQRVIFVFFAQ